jgi:acetyl-CoA carboxylase biotin carboxyl carrier protein
MGDKKHGIDKDLIRGLAELLTETDLSEIEVEQDDFRIRVTRAAPAAYQAVAAAPQPAPTPVAAAAPAAEASAPAADEDVSRHPGAVKSPMVGTAYLAPEPNAKPFVDIGETVAAGQTLMIVEAMKHMNEVPAPKAGTISAILVSDGQPVEYGEVLIVIE